MNIKTPRNSDKGLTKRDIASSTFVFSTSGVAATTVSHQRLNGIQLHS